MATSIMPGQLAELDKSGEPVELIDVRTPAEFAELHVPFARNMPLDRLEPEALVAQRNGRLSEPLYVICHSGSRGRQACERLKVAGLNAINIEGGTAAWDAAGLPVVRGRKTMSLERQVRIAAGSLVFIGAVLGYFVHPYWIASRRLCRRGASLFGSHRHVRNGNAPRPNALEPGPLENLPREEHRMLRINSATLAAQCVDERQTAAATMSLA